MFLLTDSKSGNRSHSNCYIQMTYFFKPSTNTLELIKCYKQNPILDWIWKGKFFWVSEKRLGSQ